MPSIAIVLLAAGSSSRMGRSKQLLVINGQTLLEKSVASARSASDKIVVVLGAHVMEHLAVLERTQVNIEVNENWKNGIGSSIKAGLKHATNRWPSLDGVMIMVCDQPLITSQHLNALVGTFNERKLPIVSSGYAGAIGVPAIFDQSLFPALFDIEDSAGAKKLLQSKSVAIINFPEGKIDLDTPEDYEAFLKSEK